MIIGAPDPGGAQLEVFPRPLRIVSGGQTGADRAALDVALELGLEVGGWVPRGRWAEDGPIPAHYANLRETESPNPAVRTRLNVRDSDATVVFSHGPLSGGSKLTVESADRAGRPVFHLDLSTMSRSEAAETLCQWLRSCTPWTLNVAGPRASGDPRIAEATRQVLRAALLYARDETVDP